MLAQQQQSLVRSRLNAQHLTVPARQQQHRRRPVSCSATLLDNIVRPLTSLGQVKRAHSSLHLEGMCLVQTWWSSCAHRLQTWIKALRPSMTNPVSCGKICGGWVYTTQFFKFAALARSYSPLTRRSCSSHFQPRSTCIMVGGRWEGLGHVFGGVAE
jgi:hypothetical protein